MSDADQHSTTRTLCVADSFRARINPASGRTEVRSWPKHLARFSTAVRQAGTGQDSFTSAQLEDFLHTAARKIDGAGEGFPRLELWRTQHGYELDCGVRPLPEITHTISLTSTPRPPSPLAFSVKGPHITDFAALAKELGTEALLCDAAGHVIEGTTTSLVWWHADGALGFSAAADRVPSVTEEFVCETAHRLGAAVRPEQVTPAELSESDVWAVNALHGIRPVAAIDGVRLKRHDPALLETYRAAHDRSWLPVFAPSS